jgi:GT2 family glycosyltransferase
MNTKIAIGIVTYKENTAKYLPYFLASLERQSLQDFSLLVYDNSPAGDETNRQIIRQKRPTAQIFSTGQNLGFGAAYNVLIQKAQEAGAEYVCIINPDVSMTVNCLQLLSAALDKDKSLATVAPKLYRWDFVNHQKTSILDSCGIIRQPVLQFADLGQGEQDIQQYNDVQIIGPSGAAGLFRLSALESVAEGQQYFDEHFFMYKEDCDLAMRLTLRGFRSKLVAEATAYHDRTVTSPSASLIAKIQTRRARSHQLNAWSFVNQQLLYDKFWRTLSLQETFSLLKQQLVLLVYLLLFEPYLLLSLGTLARARRGIKKYV